MGEAGLSVLELMQLPGHLSLGCHTRIAVRVGFGVGGMLIQKLTKLTRKKRMGTLVPTCKPVHFSFYEAMKCRVVCHQMAVHGIS